MIKTCKNKSAVESEEVRTGLANQCQFSVCELIEQDRAYMRMLGESDEDIDDIKFVFRKTYDRYQEYLHKLEKKYFGDLKADLVANVERCNATCSPLVGDEIPVSPILPVVTAQMRPKRKPKPSMRGSFPLRRPNIPQTLTVGLGGSGAIKKTTTIKCLSIQEVTCKASGKGGESRVTPIVFTLKDLYPLPESDDKFSEFKISKVDIALLGFELPPEEYPNTTFLIAPNPDERAAANISELLRHYGVRVVPILACQNSVVKLISVSPRFDETGSQNHYVSGFLQVGEAQGVEWYGAVVACKGPLESKTLEWKVKLLLTVTLIFRGRQ